MPCISLNIQVLPFSNFKSWLLRIKQQKWRAFRFYVKFWQPAISRWTYFTKTKPWIIIHPLSTNSLHKINIIPFYFVQLFPPGLLFCLKLILKTTVFNWFPVFISCLEFSLHVKFFRSYKLKLHICLRQNCPSAFWGKEI